MQSVIWLVSDFFEISDRRCCILSGPPCIATGQDVQTAKMESLFEVFWLERSVAEKI